MNKTELRKYDNSHFRPGNPLKRISWYVLNNLFFNSYLIPFSAIKIMILRLFGAKMGKGVVIKPNVNIKYPWFLEIGDHSWLGEGVWIDNLTLVSIGDNVCLSQGAFILTGNHNYKSPQFDLITEKVILEEGVWIGARACVAPGTICRSHSVLTFNSVGTGILNEYSIYSGNPAVEIRKRQIG